MKRKKAKAKNPVSIKDTPFFDAEAADKPGKVRITMHLDSDVLEHFKRRGVQLGEGYQTLVNRTLRRVVDIENVLLEQLPSALVESMLTIRLTTDEAEGALRKLDEKKSA